MIFHCYQEIFLFLCQQNTFLIFKVSFDGYSPVNYTAHLQRPPNFKEDPRYHEIHEASGPNTKAPIKLAFNNMDKDYDCDRHSFEENYEIQDGIPLNPMGRTGIAGRGTLPRWGPNHVEIVMVTRYPCYMVNSCFH